MSRDETPARAKTPAKTATKTTTKVAPKAGEKTTTKAAPKPAEKPPERRPIIGVTVGDPCGIGPEIVLKAIGNEEVTEKARVVVLGDETHLRAVAREQKIKWPFGTVSKDEPVGSRWSKPQLIDQDNVDASIVPGQISAAAGTAALEGLEQAVDLAKDGVIEGVVTAPIHKESLSLAGVADPGHTDLIARLAGAKKFGLMFWAAPLVIAMLSTHMSLRDAIKKVRTARIVDYLKLYDEFWRETFGKVPRIAVAALNPHGGEGMRFGTEEEREIRPAVEKAREAGMIVNGPVSADRVFAQARDGRYEFVLSLYHDQATIPVKLIPGRRAVTVTVGLPFVRTSVEHGPAMDIAGKGAASEVSLVEAIRVAAELANKLDR